MQPQSQPLGREAILASCVRPVEQVEIPGLGIVCFRAMTGAEASEVYARFSERRDIVEGITARTICDAQGERLFSLDDKGALFQTPYSITEHLTRAAMRINLVGQQEYDEAKKG